MKNAKLQQSAASIDWVMFERFRGIAEPFRVAVPAPRRTGSVLVLQGDNGSGKSSICDALEFATRGVVSRRSVGGEKIRREINNLSVKGAPAVELRMSNGRRIRRGAKQPTWSNAQDAAELLVRKSVVPGFALAPLVVRREIVESLWRVPASERLGVLWDYIRPSDIDHRSTREEAVLAQHQAAEAAVTAASERFEELVPKQHWPSRFSMPVRSAHAADALTQMTIRVAKNRFHEAKLSEDEFNAIAEFRDALKEEERLRHQAGDAIRKEPRPTALLVQLLNETGPRVAKDFVEVTDATWVKDVRFSIDESGQLSVKLHRTTGSALEPNEVLSEAALDLLALLILVELHIASADHGQAKVLVLDDVFQSVDTTLRRRTLEHLAVRLQGWQLVLTVHDRLWMEIAVERFRDKNFAVRIARLRGGGYGKTPTLIDGTSGPLGHLEAALNAHLAGPSIAGIAGRALESFLDSLTLLLSTRIERQAGERYEIRHYLDSLKEPMKNCSDAEFKELFGRIEETQFLRNRLGAHFSDWGEGLSDAEAEDAAGVVKKLWSRLACPQCGHMSKVDGSKGKSWQLRYVCSHNTAITS